VNKSRKQRSDYKAFRDIFEAVSSNQEIISFPFEPYLAKYLFVKIKKQSFENNYGVHKPLDIDLRSVHGKIIRMLLQKADFPNIDKVQKGFRLFVSIPKYSAEHNQFIEDARNSCLVMPPSAIRLLHELYEDQFRSDYHHFVTGYVRGNKGKRYSIRQATEIFIETYQLQDLIKYDTLVKFYARTHSELKVAIYDRKKQAPRKSASAQASKTLLNSFLKNKKD